jgi:hypothetical protein
MEGDTICYMSKKRRLPSSEKETWSSQVGDFNTVRLSSSSQSKSMTDSSESTNKEKSLSGRKKFGGWRIGW